jgi:methyltransferase-like protein
LLAHGAIEFRTTAPEAATTISERPVALRTARMPGRRTQWTATPFHTTLLFDAFVRYLLPFLDGQHSIADLTRTVAAAIESGEFVVQSDSNEKPGSTDIERLVVDSLEQLRYHGVLTA